MGLYSPNRFADGHVAALKFLKFNFGLEVIDLDTWYSKRVCDFVACFKYMIEQKNKKAITGRLASDLAIYFTLSSKAKILLCWGSVLSIMDICRTEWAWQQKNHENITK